MELIYGRTLVGLDFRLGMDWMSRDGESGGNKAASISSAVQLGILIFKQPIIELS